MVFQVRKAIHKRGAAIKDSASLAPQPSGHKDNLGSSRTKELFVMRRAFLLSRSPDAGLRSLHIVCWVAWFGATRPPPCRRAGIEQLSDAILVRFGVRINISISAGTPPCRRSYVAGGCPANTRHLGASARTSGALLMLDTGFQCLWRTVSGGMRSRTHAVVVSR